jgi:bacterioferritin
MTKENLIRGLNEDLAADLKGMLELNVKMESEDVANYLAHAKLAEELALPELKMKLEEMAADEAGHGRELRRLLKGL